MNDNNPVGVCGLANGITLLEKRLGNGYKDTSMKGYVPYGTSFKWIRFKRYCIATVKSYPLWSLFFGQQVTFQAICCEDKPFGEDVSAGYKETKKSVFIRTDSSKKFVKGTAMTLGFVVGSVAAIQYFNS